MSRYRDRSVNDASVRRRGLPAACLLLTASLMCTAAVGDDGAGLGARLTQLQTLYQAGERERLRLAAENARLEELLRTFDAQQLLSKRLAEQVERLERVSQRLELGTELGTAAREGPDAATRPVPEDDAARLRAELDVSQRRLQLLIEQFAEAHRMRLDAIDKASAAEKQVAELNARMQQQQQEMGEALLRAEKAEKLYAGLEDAHAHILTENERLTLELAAAKARQAEALQRVVELDTRLAASCARASAQDGSAPTASADAEDAQAVTESAATAGLAVTPDPVIYEVRADDSLSRISAKVYGDASAWRRIFEANRDLLESPDDLVLGMKLIIP